MNNLIEHAKQEFLTLGYNQIEKEGDIPNKRMQENVLELLKVFSKQEHSGFSAPYCIELFAKLAMFEPLSPLTGEDWEWVEIAAGIFQNKRCSHVFKQKDRFNGQAYDINGRVFKGLDDSYYTSTDSFVPITFPYTPTTEYVNKDE